MITKTIKIDVEADEANKELEKFDENIKETDSSTEELTSSLDGMTGGAVAGFTKMGNSIKKVILGFRTLKGAIAATGIGLLIIAVGSLAAAFTSSEEGQNKFAKIMAQIGVVTGNVIDILANLGSSLLAAGKALIKLATGDIKGASAAWSEFKDNIKETGEGIKNFVKETKEELKTVRELSDNIAKADKLDRDLLIQRAEAERDIAKFREIATRKDLYNAEQRKQALIDASNLNDEIINKEIEAQKIRLEAIRINNSLSGSTKDDLQAEAEAQAELIRLETDRYTRKKQLGAELSAINQQELAEIKAIQEARQKEIDDQIELDTKLIDDEIAREVAKEDRLFQLKLESEKKARDLAQKEADERVRIKQQEEDAKAQLTNLTFTLIQGLAKEGSALAKAAAVAQTLYNTYAGVMGAFNTPTPAPFLVKLANAATVGVMGALNVKRILSGDKGGGGGASGGGGARQSAPSFNLVGGTGTSAIADSINRQNLQPQKAYVVTSDVSSGQSLDRKIIEGASL